MNVYFYFIETMVSKRSFSGTYIKRAGVSSRYCIIEINLFIKYKYLYFTNKLYNLLSYKTLLSTL